MRDAKQIMKEGVMLNCKNFNRVGTVGRIEGAGRSVVMRRTWFADDDKQDSKYKPATLEDAQKIIDSLVKRVGERDATIDKLNASNEDFGKRIQAIEEGSKKKLEEEGNWRALAEKRHAEVESLRLSAERATALEAVIREANDAAIARIPEARRGLIPVDYAPEKLQSWLANNSAVLLREPAPDFNAGEGAGDGKAPAKLTDAERDAGTLMGVKPETLERLKAQDAKT
jgi:hypothetical protein